MNDISTKIKKFITKIEKQFPISIIVVDEYNTTREVDDNIVFFMINKKNNINQLRGETDSRVATFILNEFLDNQRFFI